MPAPRIAGREPPPRFFLENEDKQRNLSHLRELTARGAQARRARHHDHPLQGPGRNGRRQSCGTPRSTRHTRTLLQVQLDDAFKADEMFRTLMGEKVEPRREFIQKHALEVKDIDYHGA